MFHALKWSRGGLRGWLGRCDSTLGAGNIFIFQMFIFLIFIIVAHISAWVGHEGVLRYLKSAEPPAVYHRRSLALHRGSSSVRYWLWHPAIQCLSLPLPRPCLCLRKISRHQPANTVNLLCSRVKFLLASVALTLSLSLNGNEILQQAIL